MERMELAQCLSWRPRSPRFYFPSAWGLLQPRGLALLCNLFVGGFSQEIVVHRVCIYIYWVIHIYICIYTYITWAMRTKTYHMFWLLYKSVKLLSFADTVGRARSSELGFGTVSRSLQRLTVCVYESAWVCCICFTFGALFSLSSTRGFCAGKKREQKKLNFAKRLLSVFPKAWANA